MSIRSTRVLSLRTLLAVCIPAVLLASACGTPAPAEAKRPRYLFVAETSGRLSVSRVDPATGGLREIVAREEGERLQFLAFHPSGRVLWSERGSHPFDSSPVVGDDGTVYVGGDGLIAFTPRGGRRWRMRMDGHVFSPPVVHPRQFVLFGARSGEL